MATNIRTRDLLASPLGLCSTGENMSKMEKQDATLQQSKTIYTTDVKMFQDHEKPMSFGAASFSGIDPSYSLPANVALLTLQVPLFHS